jgi:hypothetical protein
MNARFVPASAAKAAAGAVALRSEAAMVTASYAPDFERCRLLCETMDRYVTGAPHHYLLVEHGDVALFRQLENARRTVIDERDLLPSWLHSFRDPTSRFRRRIWLSTRTAPLRGWHVQQLRRIAIAAHVAEDVLVYCDSDVVFVRPFDCGVFSRDGKVRLFRHADVNDTSLDSDQMAWSRNAGRVLGIATPEVTPHEYITTLIAWRRDAVLGMCRRIEDVAGEHWVAAIGKRRRFSECMTYGRYVDEILCGAGHFHGTEEFCRVRWWGQPMSDDELRAFIAELTPEQAAIGMQSFIGTDVGRVRRMLAGL